ncbi:hypothetical protein [Streptomyces sp. NPDC046759]|uniref:hypothetical protein n=1 Tax=Streptomyces sp. NPDC046759 TaxID=3155019 RepID=UPI0033CF06E5
MRSTPAIGRPTADPPRKPFAVAGPRDTGEPSGRAGDLSALGVPEHTVGRGDLSDRESAGLRDLLGALGARDLVERRIARPAGQPLRHLGEAAPGPGAAARLRDVPAGTTGATAQGPAPGGPPPAAAVAAEAGR